MVRTLKPKPRTTARRNVFARRIERRVLDYVRGREVLSQGERAIVALSGGPDSTALLTILSRLAESLSIDCTVAHFDHRLRGAEVAAADRDYVATLAEGLGLPFVQGSGDVRARARKDSQSIEDAARRLRYAFLGRSARAAGATVVITGHNLNDQAETVLLHVVRGSGIDGLAGMRPRASWPFGRGPDIARPLLCLSRQDIERYCREVDLEPRRDETNELLAATRNRIRLRVLPELEAVNPRATEALARLADSAASDADYLAAATRESFEALAITADQAISLRKSDLRALPTAIAVRVIRLAAIRLAGTSAGLEMTHLDAVLALTFGRPAQLSLPNGVRVDSDSHLIHLRKGAREPARRVRKTRLAIPGATETAGWLLHVDVIETPQSLRPPTALQAYLDRQLSDASLVVRSRRPGDRLRPLGLKGEKKLQDILVDAKVPARERDGVPIICDDAGLLWVVGHCLDERARVREDAREVLHITVQKNS